LSGAVLGMRKADINRKFDDIVDFSGVGQFLDTPVKRFSSGMQVRLGFAVAAHLDPEILLVDEVLAVGDAEFQKRCLGKMSELGEGGRTVLFVSHSMPAVLRLCETAILLDHGRVIVSGPSHAVIRTYLESDTGRTSERVWDDPSTAPGDDVARFRSVRVLRADGARADEVEIDQPIDIEIEYWSAGDPKPTVNFHLFNSDGVCVFAVTDFSTDGWLRLPSRSGVIRSTCRIPANFLAEGQMTLNVALDTFGPHIGRGGEHDVVSFQVVDRTAGEGARGVYTADWPGVVRPKFDWTVNWTEGDPPR
jgi:lipopolysaccharide transport system ATP-binding protein